MNIQERLIDRYKDFFLLSLSLSLSLYIYIYIYIYIYEYTRKIDR